MGIAARGRAWLTAAGVSLAGALSAGGAMAGSVDITTFHVNAQRTGWNPSETTLAWANVNATQFGPLLTTTLDEQVDAQPLVVSAATIKAAGASGYPNDIAVIATENNTIYEIDSGTGAVVRSRNLGTAVKLAQLPGGCTNNSAVVGINSTPVLDLNGFYMYVVAYTWENNAAVYRLHKLSLVDLSDVVAPVVVAATAALSDGTTTSFQAGSQRQRAGLLLSQGKVYAAFAGFCDVNTNIARGWLFGFDTTSLGVAGAGITDTQTARQAGAGLNLGWTNIYFLSSIWMSGYGPSADSAGNVYVLTGNSNSLGVNNYGESALKIAPRVDALMDYFKPANFATLDVEDRDFGAGGIMVAPDQPGGGQWALAAGKDGRMFLLNRNHMGGYVAGGPDVPSSVDIGGCWCGPAYFVGSDGKARIVSSGGAQAQTWFLPSGATGALTHEATSPALVASAQDAGFPIFVSSNGAKAGSAIVWAISRAVNKSVSLYAFKGDGGLGQLYSAKAGAWVSATNNANVFPVAAGGKVYVASYKRLTIFGLKGASAVSSAEAAPATTTAAPAPAGGARYTGTVARASASSQSVTLTLRTGASLTVNLAPALAAHAAVTPYPGEALEVQGAHAASGTFDARVALRAKGAALWAPDMP